MKRIVLATLVLAAAGVGLATPPDLLARYAAQGTSAGLWLWAGIEANPVPVALALGTFLLTVVYHKAKGKSLRAAVAAAATRGRAVTESADDNPVLRRAKARATRAQLLADQVALQNRHRKLPATVQAAEKEACYTEQAVVDAERALTDRKKAHDEAATKLESLRKEQAAADAELAVMEAELKKLAELV